MIPYILPYLLLCGFFVWSVYNGEVLPKEGGILGTIFIVLNVAFVILKLPLPWFIITFVSLLIYLIVKVYAGDVKIR